MSDLTNVKVGDELVLSYYDGYSSTLYKFVTVTRLTPSLVYIGEKAYMRRNGRERGGDEWHAEILKENTHENRKAVAASMRSVEARDALSYLRNNLGQLSHESIIILRDMVRDWLKAVGK